MKKILIHLILLSLFYDTGLFAQALSRADSIIWYLRQVNGLQSRDSVLLEKAVAAIKNTPADSLPVDKIDSELKRLLPFIQKQNCLAVKCVVNYLLSVSKNLDLAIRYSRKLIPELSNYSSEFEKNLLIWTIEYSRLPYRNNSSRRNEGIAYYQHLANDFEQDGDSAAASTCYWCLSGIYRPSGLMDKAIYCILKSTALHNRYHKISSKSFLFSGYDRTGMTGYVNRLLNLSSSYLDNEDPVNALHVLYTVMNINDTGKLVYESGYLYQNLAVAKLETGGDSADYYLSLSKKESDFKKDPTNVSVYYQNYGYYCYLQNRMDSAEYYVRLSADIKKANKLMNNTYGGLLLPGYYLALIKTRQHKYGEAARLLKEEIQELLQANMRKVALKEMMLLSDAYEKNGDLKKSKATLDQYIKLQNEIIDDETRTRSITFETEQQINSLNIEKQKQEKEITRQKFIRNLITGGLGLMIIFSVIFLLQRIRIVKEKKRSEGLLLNILPAETAKELKEKGKSDAKMFDEVTVMFTDFKGFTQISEKLSPAELVAEIDTCFKAFDEIITKYNIEKIKTIGDSYMCAGGLPVPNKTNAADVINAGMEIRDFMLRRRSENSNPGFEIRIGVHTGPVIAGIVGSKKFAYDIWGDTVNVASRMESSGEAGKVNISNTTFELVKDHFKCIGRGKIKAKYKGEIDMYFVESI